MTILDGSSTLLVVDDDPHMMNHLVTVIKRALGEAINVEALADPNVARQRLDQGGIAILLTDLEMPHIDGRDLLRCAKRRNVCTQVLILVAQTSHAALLSAIEVGATDYLLKPVDQGEVVALIAQAHDRHRRWQQAPSRTCESSMAHELR